MKKGLPIGLYIFFGIVILVLIGLFIKKYAIPSQEEKIKYLEEEIAYLKQETIPIKFKILDKTNDSIEVAIKFFDLDGNKISKQNFKLYGNVVSFDFIVIKINDRYVAFPEKIFTNKIKPSKGIKLYQYYEKDGYPMIYEGKDMNKKFKEGIRSLYDKIKSGEVEDLENISGNMVQNVNEVPTFKKGSVYKIIVHTKGGIEITED